MVAKIPALHILQSICFTADHNGDKSSTLANVSIRVSLHNLKHVSLCYYITSNDISETFFELIDDLEPSILIKNIYI